MPSLAEYFAKNRYHGVYSLGDRVIGKWNKIPFVGTVGNDSVVNEVEGPRITIHLDLPFKFEDTIYQYLVVKHKDVRRLKQIQGD